MRPRAIIVVDILAQHVPQMAFAEDEQPVQALGADGAYPALVRAYGACGNSSCIRCMTAASADRVRLGLDSQPGSIAPWKRPNCPSNTEVLPFRLSRMAGRYSQETRLKIIVAFR